MFNRRITTITSGKELPVMTPESKTGRMIYKKNVSFYILYIFDRLRDLSEFLCVAVMSRLYEFL